MQGYTEVGGKAANVMVANPYGITCNGCGFINTPNATLTTGKPQFDAAGNLSALEVTKGTLTVEGKGAGCRQQRRTVADCPRHRSERRHPCEGFDRHQRGEPGGCGRESDGDCRRRGRRPWWRSTPVRWAGCTPTVFIWSSTEKGWGSTSAT